MIMIQQTMDFHTGVKRNAFSMLSKKNKDSKAKEKTPAAPPYGKAAGNISVSAFCAKLAASGVTIGRNQMFMWLRGNGYISKQKGTWNMPLQKYSKEGILAVKETFVLVADEQVAKYSPLITPKGRIYLTEILTEKNISKAKKKKTV